MGIIWDKLHGSSEQENIDECRIIFSHGIITSLHRKYELDQFMQQMMDIITDVINDIPSGLPDAFILELVRRMKYTKHLDILPKLLEKRQKHV